MEISNNFNILPIKIKPNNEAKKNLTTNIQSSNNNHEIRFACHSPSDSAVITNPEKIWSKRIHKEFMEKFPEHMDWMRTNIAQEDLGQLQGRVKDEVSIRDSIKIARNGGSQIGGAPIIAADIKTLEDVKKFIPDIIGTRIVLKHGNKDEVNQIIDSLITSVKKGDIQIDQIYNCHGEKTKPYFDKDGLDKFKNLAEETGKNIDIHNGKDVISPFGFSSVLINLTHKDKTKSEFQIVGPKMTEVVGPEHMFFDIKMGKDVTKGIPEINDLVKPYVTAVNNLSDEEMNDYMSYWNECFSHARNQELGINSPIPELPEHLDSVLSYNNLKVLNEKYDELKRKNL